MKEKVAVLGLGTMGMGMARNLLKAGVPLAVYNRTADKASPLSGAGARIAKTPAEASSDADIVLSMLSDDDASRAAWLGENGALMAMREGAVLIECSTVSPAWVAALHAKAGAQGIRMLDAPVTGSRVQAEAGQLVFLAGGERDTLDQVRPVLEIMGRQVLHLGPVGSGTQLKLINNFLCGVQVVSFAEALAWIERSGLERGAALEFLKGAAPGSPLLSAMAERMTERTYEVNFLLRLMAKDLRYAQLAAASFGIPLATAEAPEAAFNKAQQQGYANQDMSAVVEVLREPNS